MSGHDRLKPITCSGWPPGLSTRQKRLYHSVMCANHNTPPPGQTSPQTLSRATAPGPAPPPLPSPPSGRGSSPSTASPAGPWPAPRPGPLPHLLCLDCLAFSLGPCSSPCRPCCPTTSSETPLPGMNIMHLCVSGLLFFLRFLNARSFF